MNTPSKHLKDSWFKHIRSWRDSGLTQQAYCKNHQLVPHQFWYWKRKLSESEGKHHRGKLKPVKRSASAFVPVSVVRSDEPSRTLEVKLPNGTCISGITQENLTIVRQLLAEPAS